MVRVVIIDDHPLFLEGVSEVLERAGVDVVGVGRSKDDAIRLVEETAPDILLLDLNIPGGGLNAAMALSSSPTRIVCLTVSDRSDDVMAALKSGVCGYVLKGVSGPDLFRAIMRANSGEPFIPPELAARLIGNQSAQNTVGKLSHREEQVLTAVAQGLTNKEVARQLQLSEKTIKHYMTAILDKLRVRNRVEAVMFAKQHLALTDKLDKRTPPGCI